uniref:(northern house mosquito) hypothetical protein n=1 Tax=Culex pipiens TaxID=7175 RepID=A0A8D8L521_CULPI
MVRIHGVRCSWGSVAASSSNLCLLLFGMKLFPPSLTALLTASQGRRQWLQWRRFLRSEMRMSLSLLVLLIFRFSLCMIILFTVLIPLKWFFFLFCLFFTWRMTVSRFFLCDLGRVGLYCILFNHDSGNVPPHYDSRNFTVLTSQKASQITTHC